MKKNKNHKHIIEQVPLDYYQTGVKNNFLQKIWHTNKLKTILDFFPNSPENILDVGCASGWFISEISKKNPQARCIGIDVYDKAIIYAKGKYPHIKFQTADAHHLPFKDNMYDVIVCTEVLEHVDNPKNVLKEIKRVLKPKGLVIIELDSGSILFSIVWYIWRKLNGKVWNDSHLHSFNVKKLDNVIAACGFSIVKKKKFNLGMAMVFLIQK